MSLIRPSVIVRMSVTRWVTARPVAATVPSAVVNGPVCRPCMRNATTIRPGTYVTVRINQPLSSDRNQPGDAFAASLARPLVVDGIMYITGPNEAYALDAVTGRQIWTFRTARTPGLLSEAGGDTAPFRRGLAHALLKRWPQARDDCDRFLLRQPGDGPTIGIILCNDRNELVVEYALRATTQPIPQASAWKSPAYSLTRHCSNTGRSRLRSCHIRLRSCATWPWRTLISRAA